MAFTPNVVDGNIILAAWGNEIRDRTCQVMATVAERDAQWPAPPNGALCVTLDTNTLWRRVNGAWQNPAPFIACGEAVVSTDGFGIWSITLPAGPHSITGVANGAQNLPFFMVRDAADFPVGNVSVGFRAFNDAGGTPNNTSISVSYVIIYRF